MRPDEYMRQDAERWNEAVILQRAIREGTNEAGSERKANEQFTQQQWPEDQD
jgi:hypothetical protein